MPSYTELNALSDLSAFACTVAFMISGAPSVAQFKKSDGESNALSPLFLSPE